MSAARTPVRQLRAMLVVGALLAALVGGAFLLPLGSYVVTELVVPALAQEFDEGKNPHANYWRAVREGDKGVTTASGPYTEPVLITNGGEIYREIRNGPIASIAPWVLAGVFAAIVLFHLLVGPKLPEEPPSGRKMPRWSAGERIMHWYVATLFIVLAVTGLSLLFGRAVLIPVIGYGAFSVYAQGAKIVHNWVGPFFVAGVIVEVVVWVRWNIFDRDDLGWLARAGGMFGSGHPHAGRVNAGEKLWFWYIAIAGLLGVCVTGLIMDFPVLGQSRQLIQTVQLLHASFAALWVALSLGHIYLGLFGTPGALEGMTRGTVSEEWMKTHHDRWYEKLRREGRTTAAPGGMAQGRRRPAPAAPRRT